MPPDLKKISALNAPDITPAQIGEPPRLEWIPITALRVNHAYQRTLSKRSVKLIRSVVEGFNWRHLKPLSVIDLGDGTYEVLDGQHTATAAATHGSIPKLPCYITEASGVAAHALAFVALNTNRVAVTPLQTFWARVAAGDEIAVAVETAAARAECQVLRKPPTQGRYRLGDTVAIVALMRVAENKGVPGCARLLRIGREARLSPILTSHVDALRYLLWSTQYRGEVPDDSISLALRSGSDDLMAAAASLKEETGQPLWRSLAVCIYRRAS